MRTWRDIPGWCGDDVARLYRRQVEQAHDGARFVEIGTWVGRSTYFYVAVMMLILLVDGCCRLVLTS